MAWDMIFGGYGKRILTRRDHYALPGTSPSIVAAVRVGGRIDCVSALDELGVFALDARSPHIHLERDASRLRSPRGRHIRLTSKNRDGAVLHWGPLSDPSEGDEYRVGLEDALAHAVVCQHPWLAIAALDNALYQGLIDDAAVDRIFRRVPAHLRNLRQRVNGRCESGQETVLRLIVELTGLPYEVQVVFSGVGRVDMVVAGCLVLEADSRLAHAGWENQVRDRDRDLALARLGFMTLRPHFSVIINRPQEVRAAIVALVDSHYAARSLLR